MNLWQENRIFAIVGGVLFVVYIYLWPSLLGRWLAPWEDPVVARPDRQRYEDAKRRIRQDQKKFDEIFHPKGKARSVAAAIKDAKTGNKTLLKNFTEMHRWMSFVPRYPFRIPAGRTKKNLRQRYVSQVYTYTRDGHLICDEYGDIFEPLWGIVFATATRNIGLGDEYFGMRDMDLPDRIDEPDLAILQIALIHEVGQLAIRSGVDEIAAIEPDEPYTWRREDIDVAKAYPVSLRLKCDLPTLMRFLHGLDGAHGRVADLAADAPTPEPGPARPAPIPAAALPDGDEPLPPEVPAPEPPEGAPQRIIVQLYGNPSIFAAGPRQAGLKERLTIFRAHQESHELTYVANAVITRTLPKPPATGDGDPNATLRVEAEIEPNSTLRFNQDGTHSRSTAQRGDYAATRFFLIRSLKVRSAQGKIETDKSGFATEVTPRHLEVDLSVAALQFLKLQLPKTTRKVRKAKRRPLHLGW